MENAVKNKFSEGEYGSISDLQGLTNQIMKDFRAVSNDRHIWIDILENLPVNDANVSDQKKIEELRKDNLGFTEFEILPGNIAYLKLDAFVDFNFGKEIDLN